MTSTVLPHPIVDDGVVTNDPLSRTLTVRPAPDASGTAKLLWRDAVRAQAAAAQPPAVWAHGGGEAKVAYGVPAGADALQFRFAPGNAAYARLVSTPGLRARIAMDRASGQIISVTFRGRP